MKSAQPPRLTLIIAAGTIFAAVATSPGALGWTTTRGTAGAINPADAFKRVVIGTGYVENSARQVIRTAGDYVYVFAADDSVQRQGIAGQNVVRAWKGNVPGIPTAFSEVDAADHPVAAGGSTNVLVSTDVRLDRAGIAHIVYVDETDGSLYYQTFSTLNDTWGPRVVIATGVTHSFYLIKRSRNPAAITLDGGDNPQVVYASGPNLYAISRVSGAWAAPVLIASGGSPYHPQLAFDTTGNLHLSWIDDSASPSIRYAQRPAGSGWLAPETVAGSDVRPNDTGDQGPSMALTTSGRPYVLWINGADYVRIKYRTAPGNWVSDNPTPDLFTHAPQVYTQNDDVYAFLGHDDQIRFGYQYHVSGQPWGGYTPLTTLADGKLDGSADIRWDPPRDNNPGVIDATFFDEDKYDNGTYIPELYYMAIIPSGSGGGSSDTTPPSVSLTSPPAGATVSGPVSVVASASDDVGVAGVQFKLDNGNLGAEDTTAPYAVSWDTSSVANGSHALSAVARDAAGNQASATTVTVTVANTAPPPTNGLVAAYGFNENSGGSTADASGKGHTGTLTNTSWTSSGKYGAALSFNGTSSWVTVADTADLDLTGALTLEAWVKPTTLGSSWRTVIFKERPGGICYSLYANQGGGFPVAQLYIGAAEQNATGGSGLPLNAWSHLAASYDGAALRLYVNGALAATKTISGAIITSTGPLRIGGNNVWPEWFNGLIDEVRIYNRALSATDIQTDMNTPVGAAVDTTPPTAPGNLTATGSLGSISLGWTASTDAIGVVRYDVYRSTTSGFVPGAANLVAQPTGTSYVDSGVAAGTYFYIVKAEDAAGNLSAASNQTSATARADTTPPSVSLTAPAAGASVSGLTSVTASASDDVGVAGVQFKLDNGNLGAEDTAAPFTLSWDTTTVANGSHTLSAVARDAAGNQASAITITVTVANTAPPAGGPVAAYGFDEGRGNTVADASGRGHTGTLTNTSWTSSGKYGAALSFNGSSSWVTVADAADLELTGALTLEAWVKPSTLGNSWRTVLFKERASGICYSLYAAQSSGLPIAQIFTAGAEQNAIGGSGLQRNAWTHLAASYDGSALRLYVNGVLVATKTIGGAITTSTGPLRIGGNSVWPEWFNGLIDEVRIYNRALTAAEIQTDMNKAV